jgi:hypothetical protein
LGGTVVLVDAKSIVETGNLSLGVAASDRALLTVAAGATYDIAAAAGISLAGTGHIDNAGLFEKTAAGGTGMIAPMLVNDGTVAATKGTLVFLDLVNDGTIMAEGGAIVLDRRVFAEKGQKGTLEIGARGTLDLASGAAAAETIEFLAPGARLDLVAGGGRFSAPITGFAHGDIVTITGATLTRLKIEEGATQTMVKALDGAKLVETLVFQGDYIGTSFALSADPKGGFDVTASPRDLAAFAAARRFG